MKIFSHNGLMNKLLQLWIIVLLTVLPLTAAYSVTINFNTMLTAIQKNSGPIIRIVVATAYVIGVWFIISSINALKQVGQSSQMQMQSHGLSGPIIKFVIGLMLLYLPSTIDIGVWTLWGHTALGSAAKSYMEYIPSGGDIYGSIKQGAIAIVRIVGYVSFVHGLIILSRSSDQGAQPGTFGKGFIHIVGGILAINIVETIRIIGNTLGISII